MFEIRIDQLILVVHKVYIDGWDARNELYTII